MFEIFVYYICIVLGMFNIYKLKVDPDVINDPFETGSDMEMRNYDDAG